MSLPTDFSAFWTRNSGSLHRIRKEEEEEEGEQKNVSIDKCKILADLGPANLIWFIAFISHHFPLDIQAQTNRFSTLVQLVYGMILYES